MSGRVLGTSSRATFSWPGKGFKTYARGPETTVGPRCLASTLPHYEQLQHQPAGVHKRIDRQLDHSKRARHCFSTARGHHSHGKASFKVGRRRLYIVGALNRRQRVRHTKNHAAVLGHDRVPALRAAAAEGVRPVTRAAAFQHLLGRFAASGCQGTIRLTDTDVVAHNAAARRHF